METSILNSKGQVVIPSNIRMKYGLNAGTPVGFVEKNGEIVIHAMTKEYFEGLAGWLREGSDIQRELMDKKKKK